MINSNTMILFSQYTMILNFQYHPTLNISCLCKFHFLLYYSTIYIILITAWINATITESQEPDLQHFWSVRTIATSAETDYNNVKSFLQCNLRSCPSNVKTICYQSMVRSILDYASTIWSPYTQRNI